MQLCSYDQFVADNFHDGVLCSGHNEGAKIVTWPWCGTSQVPGMSSLRMNDMQNPDRPAR